MITKSISHVIKSTKSCCREVLAKHDRDCSIDKTSVMPNQLAKKICSSTFRSLCHYGHDFIAFWSYILQCKNSKGFDNKMFIYSRPAVMVIYLFSLSQQRSKETALCSLCPYLQVLKKRTEIQKRKMYNQILKLNSDISYIDIN